MCGTIRQAQAVRAVRAVRQALRAQAVKIDLILTIVPGAIPAFYRREK
jgi:hypothetical protein